jgi:hypothetical protein
METKFKEFCYGVSVVPERYLRFPLILDIDFYYVIDKSSATVFLGYLKVPKVSFNLSR